MKQKINILCEFKLNFYNLIMSNWSILYENKNYFYEKGYIINFFDKEHENIFECDILIISSRFFYKNNSSIEDILIKLSKFRKKNPNILWFDLRDSAGTTQFEIMPYVKYYVKSQVYKDLSNYKLNLYGGRMYSEFYHKKFNINDSSLFKMHPLYKKYYSKIKIGWNLGVIRYDYLSNLNILKKMYYKSIGYGSHLNLKEIRYSNFNNKKIFRLFSIFNSNFPRETIKFQRELALKKLNYFGNSKDLFNIKLSKKDYLKKINLSKYVLSCYGWGEVCFRDWEAVINNSLILKPNMSNIDTWPNIYQEYKTYIPLNWDLSDLEDELYKLEKNYYNINQIKKTAYEIYKSIRSNNYSVFRKRFLDIIS